MLAALARKVGGWLGRRAGREPEPGPASAVDAVVEPLRETARRSRTPGWLAAWRTRIFAGLAATGLFLFGALTVLVTGGATASADLAVTTAVQGFAFPWVGPLMIGVSLFGFPPQSLLMVAGVATLFWLAGQRTESGFLLAAGASSIAAESIKAVVARPRPAADLVNVLAGAGGHSFPSGHTLFYVTFFGFLAYVAYALWKRGWFRTAVLWACSVLIALVGVSRVWMGQHWASDVLASYALGMACLWLLIQVYSRYRLSRADAKLPATAGVRSTGWPAPEPAGG